METFVLELGNRQSKIKNRFVSKVYPSYYLDAEELNSRTSVVSFNRSEPINHYVSANDPNFVYAWGRNLDVDGFQVVDTISFKNRYSSLAYKVLVDLALGELSESCAEQLGNEIRVNVITGVPTNDYLQSDALLEISKTLKGEHKITVNSNNYKIIIEDVYILPQPMGTILNEVISEQGKVIDDHPLLNSHVGVVDIGGGTVLFDTLHKMQLDTNTRAQLESGAFTLYDSIQRDLIKQGYTINVQEIEQILRNSTNGKYEWNPNGRVTDISDTVMNHRLRFTRKIVNKAKAVFKGHDRLYRVLITGGGSNLVIKSEFRKEIPNVQFVTNPEVATMNGFYKYAIAQGISSHDD